MRISDWSSDVCSSDLSYAPQRYSPSASWRGRSGQAPRRPNAIADAGKGADLQAVGSGPRKPAPALRTWLTEAFTCCFRASACWAGLSDWKGVGDGRSVEKRLVLSGVRQLQKKK